ATPPAPNAVAARRLATRRPFCLLITPPLRATTGSTRCLPRVATRLLPQRAAALPLDRQAAREPVQRHARDAQFARGRRDVVRVSPERREHQLALAALPCPG